MSGKKRQIVEKYNRAGAIARIKKAYEQKELGFQRRAKNCTYYDPNTHSCCAIGILMNFTDKDKYAASRTYGLDEFCGIDEGIESALNKLELIEWNGLTYHELIKLQNLHDNVITKNYAIVEENNFKEYLYSLK